MKKRAVTLLLCLVLVVLSLLRGFAASAAGIIPATKADFDVPCAAAILIDEDSGTVLYEKNADARRADDAGRHAQGHLHFQRQRRRGGRG